jgi:hypothetical protein
MYMNIICRYWYNGETQYHRVVLNKFRTKEKYKFVFDHCFPFIRDVRTTRAGRYEKCTYENLKDKRYELRSMNIYIGIIHICFRYTYKYIEIEYMCHSIYLRLLPDMQVIACISSTLIIQGQ